MAFSYYRSLTVDHTKCGSSDSTDFPILVSGSHTTLQVSGGHVLSSTGDDILFFTDSTLTTQLPSEIDYYNPTTGVLVAWVKKTVSHTGSPDTTIYIAYGNASPPSRTTNPWDSNYKGVWHLGDGTTLTAGDSTLNGNNGTLSGATLPTATAGKMNGGANFNGTTAYIRTPFSTALGTSDVTESVWFKTANTNAQLSGLIGTRRGGPNYSQFTLYFAGDINAATGGKTLELTDFDVNNDRRTLSATNVADGGWHYAVMVRDASSSRLYIDGALNATSASGTRATLPSDNFMIGVAGNGGTNTLAGYFFNGALDEIRVSLGIGRSGDWITTEYNNQNVPGNIGAANFLTWGSETSPSGGGTSSLYLPILSVG